MIACLAVASCSSPTDEPTTTSSTAQALSQEDIFWASIWSADPDLDMFSRAGELARGTVEAGYLAQAYGVGKSFPGYVDALGPGPLPRQGDPARQQIAWAYPPPDLGPGAPNLTALFYHLVELDADDESVSATICAYSLAPDQSERSRYLDTALSVRLIRNDGPIGRPGEVDTAERSGGIDGKVPTWNIFDPWVVTESRLLRGEAIPAQCTAWWKSVFPYAVQGPSRGSMQLPGPAPTAATGQVQYPKWIGPATTE